MTEQHERGHRPRSKLVEAVKGGAMMYGSTALLIFGLSRMGVISPEPFGYHILVVSLAGATLGLVAITGFALVLGVVMAQYLHWRYGHRVIYVGDSDD